MDRKESASFTLEYTNYFANNSDDFDEECAYDTVDIMDFKFNTDANAYTYPCPCGDVFIITSEELLAGETIARCPSCSLIIHVVYEQKDLEKTVI